MARNRTKFTPDDDLTAEAYAAYRNRINWGMPRIFRQRIAKRFPVSDDDLKAIGLTKMSQKSSTDVAVAFFRQRPQYLPLFARWEKIFPGLYSGSVGYRIWHESSNNHTQAAIRWLNFCREANFVAKTVGDGASFIAGDGDVQTMEELARIQDFIRGADAAST